MDFDLDPEIMEFICDKNVHLLNEVTKDFKRKELDKIFESNGIDKFFYIANRYNMSKYLNISYEGRIINTYDKYGIWAQIETDLPFSNKERKIINSIKEIVDKKNISLEDLNNYDIEAIYNASSILGLENKVKVFEDFSKLHSIIDIDLDLNSFIEMVVPDEAIKIYKIVERSIMEGLLINRASEIKEFIRKL